MTKSSHSIAHAAILTANIFGGGSLLLFGWFLFFGPLKIVILPMEDPQRLTWNTGLSLLFFIQHSMMIRKSFKQTVTGKLPAHFYGWVYTIASALVLLALVLLWQPSDQIIWQVSGWGRWFLRSVFLVGCAGILWSVASLHYFDAFGTRMIRAHIRQVKTVSSPLASKGPYRLVRHPIYFFVLLMIWSYPVLSADRLLFNLLFTLWMIVATFWEERDLKREFGEAYHAYQKQVPMLIPWKVSASFKN
jgi:protein-S-isoprenylcysteine O-methyltransferase Ste14